MSDKIKRSANNNFPIVGIGASAGGVEALKSFFSALPDNTDMAFVVVTHRDPAHTNLLPEILGRLTSMVVLEAKDGIEIKPGHVYLSPASYYMNVQQGKLIFEEVTSEIHVPLPIDFFFRSLASERKEQAICIILSGAGSDGTLGMQAIKGEGGMAMAQDLGTAQFTSMPSSAIATELVDYVLPADQLPARLLSYVQGIHTEDEASAIQLHVHKAIPEILTLLRLHTGNDFSFYKPNTLYRRIERRMNVHHITDSQGYLKYLKENNHEIDLLFKELLIGVTAFFRDAPAFEVLEKTILPELLQDKNTGDQVRIWTPGCSTGEEAYSIAILFQEYMDKYKKQLHVQIFATDLDERAINQARSGIFSDGIALDVTAERLQRFFTREDNYFRVKKSIREMVIFATHNVIQDPVFTKLDMVCCRNLLIYLDSRMQKHVLPLFHYSLRPGGIMFLGSSETIGSFTDLFTAVDTRWKIFTRKEVPLSINRLSKFIELPRIASSEHHSTPRYSAKNKEPTITELAQKLLLREYVPPSVIVNDKGHILFIHGRTGLYLEPHPGQVQPSQNVLDMAREGLKLPLAALIRKASLQDSEILHETVNVKTNGHYTLVNLRARKIAEPEPLRGFIWIAFEIAGIEEISSSDATKIIHIKQDPLENEQMEYELQFIKKNLQSTIEELEISNEELKSTNEELQSTNEELQSANEELETAKEEMQSLNEELQTVNAELETKIDDLSYANDDMRNLLNSTGIATIFLDNNLNIKRFTVQAKKLIHLIPSDIGRPIRDIVSELEYNDLVKDAAEVLQTLVYKEIEVRTEDWSWYLMRIMPYRTAENVIKGLVITFVDITKLKNSDILQAAHNTVLTLFTKGEAIKEILNNLLKTIEEQTSSIRCSVTLFDKKTQQLYHGAAPNLPEALSRLEEGVTLSADATTPMLIAAYQRKQVVIRDIASDMAKSEFQEMALGKNLKSCWAEPIFSLSGELLGILSIYYHKPHQPSSVEEGLIAKLLFLISITLTRKIPMERK